MGVTSEHAPSIERDVLSDVEWEAVINFVKSELGGRRVHKVGAAAVLMLRDANMHQAADALLEVLAKDPDVQRALQCELRIGDVVQHKRTARIGKVTGFAHDGTTDVMVNQSGPYPQIDFDKLRGAR